MSDDIDLVDLGHDHSLRFFRWAPDDLPANRERYGVPLPVVEKAGAIVTHKAPDGSECSSGVHFDLPQLGEAGLGSHVWQVESWEPLTLSPSLLCRRCGDHGFIRDGRWIPA